jgi:hypothetical protein
MMILRYLQINTRPKVLGDIMNCRIIFAASKKKLEQIIYLREKLLSQYRQDEAKRQRWAVTR